METKNKFDVASHIAELVKDSIMLDELINKIFDDEKFVPVRKAMQEDLEKNYRRIGFLLVMEMKEKML